jgi:hypothetical protein
MGAGYKLIVLAEAQPGMVLSDVLLDRAGQMLLAKGAVLSAAILASLARHGVGMVPVQTADTPVPDAAQVQARLDHLFRRHARDDEDDWATSVLRRHIEDYRLAREVTP